MVVLATVTVVPARLWGSVLFTDVTQQIGIVHVQTTPDRITEIPGTSFFTGGAAAGDFDGDGHVDLVFTRLNDSDILYRNLGNGTFEMRTTSAGFAAATLTNGVVSGDLDNDGDLDLYMTAAGDARNYLYLNDGRGFFTDVGIDAIATLATGRLRMGQGASFGDYDNDGFLDLVTSDWGNTADNSQSRLLRNLGPQNAGSFEDLTASSGINVYRNERTFRFSPRFVDLDRDGNLDLTFAADFQTSQLFWNNGDGTFADGTIAAGLGTDRNGMGSTFGDYDGDGDLDWFITNITEPPGIVTPFGGWNRLYRNEGDRTFTDVTQQAQVRDSSWSWGTTFFDFDNDGDLDLIATNGFNGAGWRDDRTVLWQNNNGVFTDVSDAMGINDRQQGRGLIHVDFDEDGDLDVVVVNHLAAPVVYRNDGGNDNHFLRVQTQGTVSNRDGIGAWITVTPDRNSPERTMVWEVDGGSSFLSQNERVAHFGLGPDIVSVDELTIRWSSGIEQTLHNVAADQTIVVIESAPTLAADFNHDGVVDGHDLVVWQSQYDAPIGSVSGNTVADANGDGKVDGVDFLTWQHELGSSSTRTLTVPEPSALLWLIPLSLLGYSALRS